MKNRQCHINISAPNLVTVCVDQSLGDEMSGRLYHCYHREPWPFSNVVQLLRRMEELFDAISFPQASTKTRQLVEQEPQKLPALKKVVEQKELLSYRGEEGTFVTWVRFRQNSEWQGELTWMEEEKKEAFFSTLDFIKLISNALSKKKGP